jgi:YegS/Rv2252/BmrU family lipid kinase
VESTPEEGLKLPSVQGTIFFNRAAGARLGAVEVAALETAASELGLEIVELNRENDVPQTVREQMQAGKRLFIAAGGDGTVNAVIQALVHSETATLAVLPIGTYNHFARDMGIPLDWRSALDVAMSGTTLQVDAARANERFFVNNISMGLYPELVARREEKGRDYPRWKARFYAAYVTLRKYPHVTMNIETEHHHEVIRTHVFMVSNNSYDLSRLGIEAPRSTLTGGRLSVYWLPHLPRIALMRFCAHYLAGRVHATPGFRSFRTARMKVQSSHKTLHVGIDGELFTQPTPLTITIVPSALNVKVPR